MEKDVNKVYEEYKNTKKRIVENDLKVVGVKKAKLIYPATKILLEIITLFSGEKIKILHSGAINNPNNRPIIFANTHRFKPDFEKITIVTKQPSFVVASDFKNSFGNISGWYFNTRPTIFIDPYSSEDKKISYELMKKYINADLNCTIFPEAVWNLSQNRIMLDTFFGTVKLALETNSLIVCTGIERYGKRYIINKSDSIDMTEILRKYTDKEFNSLDEEADKELREKIIIECNSYLRDIMATLLYDIWEYEAKLHGITIRQTISKDYWEKFVDGLVLEWPGYEMRANVEEQYQNPCFIEQKQVEEDLEEYISLYPAFFLASNERFSNYIDTINNIEKILEISRNFREKEESLEQKSLEERLEDYKKLKRNQSPGFIEQKTS